MLDSLVREYVAGAEEMKEVRALLSGEVTREDYIRLLKTFYAIEHLSQRAVLKARENTKDSDPYLSKRFDICARGELGHAEIALRDLADMGVTGVESEETVLFSEYDSILQKEAEENPVGILGHSYLFENASAIIFPIVNVNGYPSRFAQVHAKEDPGHSEAIKRTVRNVEQGLSEEEANRVVDFAERSGEYLLRMFRGMKA